ncbi:MAG: hypothetical protein FJ119_12675, partial [Deltaproteobacteria bacterium]|nr:hypothetical protein [Deltaproteobacteria bacterium]
YDAETGYLLAMPYRFFEVNGIRVAIIAYASPKAFFFTPAKNKASIDVREDVAKLQHQVSYLRDKAELVVLVSHQGLEQDRQLAERVKGVDVIIGGHSQELTLKPEKVGDTLIVQAGKEGEYLGEITLQFEDGHIVSHSYNLNPLTEQIPADAKVAALIKEWDDLVAREMEKSPIKLPEPHQTQIVWDHYPVAGTCRECHTEVHAAWEKTPHGRAIESLKASGRLNNPECLYCHTTGYGREGGFKTMEKTPELAGVQCASCHDVQPEHLQEASSENVATVSDKRLCLSCHTVDKSPGFNHSEYMQKVHGDTVTQSE